ncbi:glycoside hydrolase family 26 protein [Pollutibacter soli]|uniref:glycoside hydrolase family 26 protein n=1 Tax=Pollutibacter soli TaxID=3034157 RepID=UPI00301363BF
MNKKSSVSLIIIVYSFLAATGFAQKPAALIDKKATAETKNLAKNLHILSADHILFGHQHATEYGHGWSGDADRSDVKSVTGSHPAVIGIDLMGLSGRAEADIQKTIMQLQRNVSATYDRGGVTTVAWHFSNPVSGGGFYWKDSVSKPAVKLIIPGGSHHSEYKSILRHVADFANGAKGSDGKTVPMIFRPYHEFDGNWFWWGRAHSTAEEFKQLWRFTIAFLRDSLNVHNFIYAFSPDNLFNTEEIFLERYPGDEWVDMLGMDNYGDFGRNGKYNPEAGLKKLKIVSDYAAKKGKLAAFTETGLESIPRTDWWTEVLLKTVKNNNLRLSYVLVWRNDVNSPTHYYAPFPGQASEADFLKFYQDEFTFFEKDLKNIYR